MKKIILAFIASISLTSAIAQSTSDTKITFGSINSTFELKKANVNTGIFANSLTPYQQCVMSCLAIYGTWDDRGLDRCIAKCS